MKKITETYFCDCCGKEIQKEIISTDETYYSVDPYKTNDFKIPYVVEFPDEDDPEPKWGYDFYRINDICNECMKKLLSFTKNLLSDPNFKYNN